MKLKLAAHLHRTAFRHFLCGGAGLALCALPGHAVAQQISIETGPSFTVGSSVTATGTYSDIQRSMGFSGGEFVAVLTPAVRISGRLGPWAGSFDYSLSVIRHSRNRDADRTVSGGGAQNGLNTAFTLTPVDNFAFIDVQASISQQSASPFGQQSGSNTSQINDNITEVRSLYVSPYLRGALGEVADFEVRLGAAATNARSSTASDSRTNTASLLLRSPRSGSVLGWALNASRQSVDFSAGRATVSDRFVATVFAAPHPDLQLSLNGGRESTDVGSTTGQRGTETWGWGARWTPTERTNVQLQSDRRYFGRSHSVSLQHRMARSVWSYTDTRATTGGGDPRGVGRPLTLFDVYFTQFASVQPDPLLREQLVLAFLRSIGANPNDSAGGGLLTTAVSLQRRQDLSLALLGKRTTLSLQAYANDSRVLDNPTGAIDGDPVVLRGYTGTLSYRLTPTSSVNLLGAQQKTLATRTRSGNDLKSLSLSWIAQPWRRTSASLSLRHAVFDSTTDAYRDSSVAATISMQF